MLDSDCTNACAFNGLPGPMRHWFTGFTHTHSLTQSLKWLCVSAHFASQCLETLRLSAHFASHCLETVYLSAHFASQWLETLRFVRQFDHIVFFPLTSFGRDKVSRSCFTGRLRGIGTAFIQASLQMCKVQRLSPNTKSTDESGWIGGEAAGVCGVLVGVVRGGHFFFSAAPF